MKHIIIVILAGMVSLKVSAQSQEAEQLLLDWQKLTSLKQILKDMQTGYQIVSKGYTVIQDISQGSFNLHEAFLDGLWLVSPAVRKYWKIPEIINGQLFILKEYKTAFANYKQGGYFNPDEILYLGTVYNNLINQSVKNLADLTNILTANKLRMSDDERFSAIDKIHADMRDEMEFLQGFDNGNSMLALQRARQQNELGAVQQLYGR